VTTSPNVIEIRSVLVQSERNADVGTDHCDIGTTGHCEKYTLRRAQLALA